MAKFNGLCTLALYVTYIKSWSPVNNQLPRFDNLLILIMEEADLMSIIKLNYSPLCCKSRTYSCDVTYPENNVLASSSEMILWLFLPFDSDFLIVSTLKCSH
jgi:hypothetical protein